MSKQNGGKMIKFYNARAKYCLDMFEKTRDKKELYLAKLFNKWAFDLIKEKQIKERE